MAGIQAMVPKRRLGLLLGVVVALLMIAPVSPASAQTTQTAQVSLTATGFQPSAVTIPINGTVIWTVSTGDSNPHSVKDPGGAFDSGPLSNGQQFTHQFIAAGTYSYSSWFDCHNDASGWLATNGNFNCQATVSVVNGPVAVPAANSVSAASPSTGPCHFVLGFATIAAAVPQVGQCVDNEHPDPSGNGNQVQTTSGGLMVWRKADNWTAFTNGYMTWVNGPNGIQSRLNTARFAFEHDPVTTAPPPAPVAPAATATPTPAATPAPANVIVLSEDHGFYPNPLTIGVGQTVTWQNNGTRVHSVVQDGGGFDSGGVDVGHTYSHTFPVAGTYSYHSSTEQVTTVDSNGN
ncbi:MAG: hypothetical protein ACRDF8_01320, partial [Chloroflexota bacterium]